MPNKRRRKRRSGMNTEKPLASSSTKTRSWTVPTVLGLTLSVVGALGVIELRPQLSMSAQEQLATNAPFSAPFELTNTGYLSVHIEHVIAIAHRIEFGNDAVMKDEVWTNIDWSNFDLIRGGSKTFFPRFANFRPRRADMVFVVDYRFLGKSWRWFFRFQGDYIDNWHWSKQPIGDLEPSIDKLADSALAELVRHPPPPSNPN
jgi:hypothetical protein